MSETTQTTPGFKPKKSVALSGTPAGNTAVCTVGRTGNDLHYRGYDILEFAEKAEFEEIAHLIIHGTLPTASQLKSYKAKLKGMRGLPTAVKNILENIPPSAHPMDVMRTGCSAMGTCMTEKDDHPEAEARAALDRLMASFGSMLLYWYHFSHNGKRIETETEDDSIGGHFLHMLHGELPSDEWVKAMHVSLILYAEHEFNASTFTGRVIAGTESDIHSCITGAIGALRGPKHGGANEWPLIFKSVITMLKKLKRIFVNAWHVKKLLLALVILFIPFLIRVMKLLNALQNSSLSQMEIQPCSRLLNVLNR